MRRLAGSAREAPMMRVWDSETLLALDDAAFREVVDQYVPKRSDPDGIVWEALHDPAVIARTYTTLVEMVRETDNLLTTRAAELDALRQECYRRGEAGKRDWFDAEAEHKVWRGRALAWKRALEARLMVAKEHRRDARIDRNAQQFPRDDQTARAVLSRLGLAVHRHEVASKAEGINPEPHDTALWAALDQLTVPYGGLVVTLRSLIDSGAWN
jgi:hypothetical protein